MKFSSKVLRCHQSPMRKFHPYAVAAAAAGKKIYHLNIGQPDIETPKALFEAVRSFHEPVLAYAESPGKPALIEAICRYYARIGVAFDPGEVLITTGGSEALQIAASASSTTATRSSSPSRSIPTTTPSSPPPAP